VLNVIDMSDWLRWIKGGTVEEPVWYLVPPEPVVVTGSGDRVYLGNERHDSIFLFEIDGLEASAVRTGELQVAHLEVSDRAAIAGDLGVRGGLSVGAGGALIQGALAVQSEEDSYIGGRLGIGPVGTSITVGTSISDYHQYTLLHPTHQLDVDGEARFRVNDHNHLVLRSPNNPGHPEADEDAYIDFVQFTYPDLITPSARIAFDAADPMTHTTKMTFYTQGPDDATMVARVRISERGDLMPSYPATYTLGHSNLYWQAVYASNYFGPSDARYKENVRALPYGLDEVIALHPVAFTWIDRPDEGLHYGLIAQEVRDVLPEVVSVGEDKDDIMSIDYGELVPVLVRAVQEQQDEIEAQADQIAALEARLTALEEGADAPSALRTPGIVGLGGILAGVLVVTQVRRKERSQDGGTIP
jgi:hypothetical protein